MKAIITFCFCCIPLYLFLFALPVFAASIDISSGPSQVNFTDEYVANVKVSIKAADDTVYYLRGVFHKENSKQYCGYTWNGNDWYNEPVGNGNNFFPIKIEQNAWQGTVRAKIDASNNACSLSGQYYFKIYRYTGNSSAGNDETLVEQLVYVVLPTPTLTSSPSPSPTKVPTNTPTPKPSITPSRTPTPKSLSTATHAPTSKPSGVTLPVSTSNYDAGTSISPSVIATNEAILGVSTMSAHLLFISPTHRPTPSPKVIVASERSTGPSLWLTISSLIGFLCLGGGILLFLRERKKRI